MIKKYLTARANLLTDSITEKQKQIAHNNIVIDELDEKIKVLSSYVDEASKVFSVKARETNSYTNSEAEELNSHKVTLVADNAKLQKLADREINELKIVKKCLDDYENVSRETNPDEKKTDDDNYEAEKSSNRYISENVDIDMSGSPAKKLSSRGNASKRQGEKDLSAASPSLINKLTFIKTLIRTDPGRAGIEIDELIKKYNK